MQAVKAGSRFSKILGLKPWGLVTIETGRAGVLQFHGSSHFCKNRPRADLL